MKIAIFVMMATLTAAGQTAKVIQLTPQETAQIKALHEQKDQTEKKMMEFDESIRKHHLIADESSSSASIDKHGVVTYMKPGWIDFEYSDDYRFIVPKPFSVISGSAFGGCQNWVAAPVTGTFTDFSIGNRIVAE